MLIIPRSFLTYRFIAASQNPIASVVVSILIARSDFCASLILFLFIVSLSLSRPFDKG